MKIDSIVLALKRSELRDNASIELRGWTKKIRKYKDFGFIEINDGSQLQNVQIVFDSSISNYNEVAKVTIGSSLYVKGKVRLTPMATQKFEIVGEIIEIEGHCDHSYPLQKKYHSLEFLRTIPHLRGRTNVFSAVFRVRSELTYAINLFLHQKGFINITTPCITTSDCEGAGEVFKLTSFDLLHVPKTIAGEVDYSQDFFGKETFMTVSGQLNVEPFCMAFRNVYTMGPCFRAENSNTTRHVAEFWQVEPEMAYVDLDGLMEVIEEMIKYIVKYVLENAKEELDFLDAHIENGLVSKLESIAQCTFARITYAQAMDILSKSNEKFNVSAAWGNGIQTEHERYLSEKIFKRPVFVTDYPKEIKAFYMRLNDDRKTVAATDLLFPGIGEIVGASQREERYNVLLNRINELGLSPDSYWWYLDMRRYGTCIHSGFGLGIERMTRFVTGVDNIRDVIPYPRTPNSAEF